MNRHLLFLIATIIAVIATSCDRTPAYRIGVSQCSSDDWREKMNSELRREAMLHDDAEIEIRSADDSNEKQIADIGYFINNDFDIIIVAPNEAAELTPVISEAYRSGMPIIIFDRNILDTTYTAHIGVDNAALGSSAAHYALSLHGADTRAIEIYGLRGSTPADERHKGFANELTHGGGTLLATADADWKLQPAREAAEALLRAHPETNVVFAHNDRMAIGASEAAEALGIRDKVNIIGIDAAPSIGVQGVADGKIDATFIYPTEGHRLIRTAMAILRGEPFDREQTIPSASAVDATNADIILLQYKAIQEESDKLKVLKSKIDLFAAEHTAQTWLFYASIAIIVLLFGVVFLFLRSLRQRARHQTVLLEQNRILENERDKQAELNSRLQEATQSKLMFFTNVSHDLRTPLTLIAEPVAQLAAADNLTPQQRTLIRIADKNVRVLKRLINQILDFRKYENGKLELAPANIDICAALNDWTEGFRPLARTRGIKFKVSVPDSPIIAAVDGNKLERVIFNLLSNAFKYTPTPSDGAVIAVKAYTEDNDLVISVSDTGRGIADEDIEHIFERFYQVDKVNPRGSGIGLSLCRAFVELHGGTLTARSAVGEGSTFIVRLPLHKLDSPVVAAPESAPPAEIAAELDDIDYQYDTNDGRDLILVVDDNADIRSLVRQILGDNYNIIEASGGEEAIRRAVRAVPDLIVCDVMMPGTDGLAVCRKLKGELSTSHIPILLLTACALDEQRIEGYDSGADGYLAKPFDGAILKARCKALIANRKRISSGIVKPSASNNSKSHAAPADIDDDFYRRFADFFAANIANPNLSVDAAAAALGLERSQLYRKIKALTGLAPVELIRRLRLRQGREMVVQTDSTVSEIAYACGFSTPAYFTKCYREAYGCTPSETRASLRNES